MCLLPDGESADQQTLLRFHTPTHQTGRPAGRLDAALLRVATQIEAVAQKLFESKEATSVDVLKAKALRLRGQADLHREQERQHH